MNALAPGSPRVRLGLRANLAQFTLLVAVNALVGGMLGQERTVLPLLADQEFHLDAYTARLAYIVAFGAIKAATNYLAGTCSDRFGRKPVLVAGWLVALPVPLLLIWAPSWGWVVAANVLLGINQGLTWSTTVIMKIDLVGPARRGLAMGLNEAAGYVAVAATALATGFIAARYGLRPEPFYLGIAYAALGLGLSAFAVRETRGTPGSRRPRTAPVPTAATPSARRAHRPTGLRPDQLPGAGTVRGQPSRPGQQPQRRAGLGPVPGAVRRGRPAGRPDRDPGRAVPRGLGPRPARHRSAVRPDRTQTTDHRRDAAAGGSARPGCARPLVRNLGARRRGARCRHRTWSTRHSSPPSATSPTPPGGHARSGSTGSGVTVASPSAPCPPACSPTPSASPPLSGRSQHSPPPPGWSSPCGCTKPTHHGQQAPGALQGAVGHHHDHDKAVGPPAQWGPAPPALGRRTQRAAARPERSTSGMKPFTNRLLMTPRPSSSPTPAAATGPASGAGDTEPPE